VAPAEAPREIRIVRLTKGDADEVIDRVNGLYARQVDLDESTNVVEVERDPGVRTTSH
jgi:hypothetical protein